MVQGGRVWEGGIGIVIGIGLGKKGGGDTRVHVRALKQLGLVQC